MFLTVIMLFSVMPAAVFATQEGLPVMKVFNVSSVDDFHATAYCGKVYSVTFLDRIDTDSISASDTVASWDISHAGDSSVMAWAKINDIETTAAGADRYDIYIGGETFFPVYGNSHLEVEHGTEIIIKARDLVGDPFTFYVNGTAVKPDENGYIRILVDRYLLIGALGIPVEAPDVEESMSLIEKFIKAIKDFFNMIASWFKR